MPGKEDVRAGNSQSLTLRGGLPVAVSYALAVLSVAVATAIRWLLDPEVGDSVPYVTYFLASVVVMRFSGFGPSILAVVLSAVVGDYFFVAPRYTLLWNGMSMGQLAGAGIYVAANLVVLGLAQTMRRTMVQAEAHAQTALHRQEELEKLLVERDQMIAERRVTEEALRESEQRVRLKLDSILSPEGQLGNLELADIMDCAAIQSLLEEFYRLTRMPVRLVDVKGRVLVGVGRQEICTQFHQAHPRSCRHCIESDLHPSPDVSVGECRLSKCKNNLWDMATPIMVGGHHTGKLFFGQFLFEDEPLDYERFRSQAREYGFHERAYLDALEKVPRLRRDSLAAGMAFFAKLAAMLSRLSYSNIKLARTLAERETLTAALRRSEEQLRVAALAAEIGVWSWTPGTSHVTVGANWRGLFGVKPATEVAFETWRDAMHPEDREQAIKELNAASEQKREFNAEYRVVRPDGSVRWLVDRGRASYDETGRAISMAGINLDITKRKQAEQALAAAREQLLEHAEKLEKTVQERTAELRTLVADLEHFSFTLTHDLRAPLRAMNSFAQIMWEGGCGECGRGDGEPKSFLQRILTAGRRMDGLILEALDYSRALRGDLVLTPVDAAALLREILQSYPNLQNADIALEGPIPLVLANEVALTQCFSNLLGNGVKFVPPGRAPRVRVRAERHNGSVRVWFEDNGIGISPENQQRVFQMFYRVSANYEGTGIGLALVRKNAEKMGGNVGVESEPGKGSRFWLELKAA